MVRLSIGLAVALAVVVSGTSAFAPADAAQCKQVRGHFEERLATEGCTSPVGLCTVAEMFGALRGEALFTASSIIPSADTIITDVVFVIGDTVVVDAQLAGGHGTLSIKNAAAFRTVEPGDLADAQTIIGGTEDFAGATGSLRISGTFVGTAGSATYE